MKTYFFVYICYVFSTPSTQQLSKQRKIGAIFDHSSQHLADTFKYEVIKLSQIDNDIIMLSQTHQIVDCKDSFEVSNAICNLLEQNVYGIIGAFQSCALSTIQSYTDTFQVPFIALGMPQQSLSSEPYQLYIRPAYIKGLLDIVKQKKWRKILYIYESDEGLVRLQQIFQEINKREMDLDIVVKRIVSLGHCREMLKSIYNTEVNTDLRIFLDLTTDQSEKLITTIKKDPDFSNNRFHFLLIDLGIFDMQEVVLSGGLNVSGFSLRFPESNSWDVNSNRQRTFGEVLVHDAVQVFHRALKKTDYVTIRRNDELLKCRDNEATIPMRPGKRVLDKVKEVEIVGQSGMVKFDDQGLRTDFKLPFYEARMNLRIAKVGDYEPSVGMSMHDPITTGIISPATNVSSKGRKWRITTHLVTIQ